MDKLEKEFEQMLINKRDPDLINKWADLKAEIVKTMKELMDMIRKLDSDALKDS